MLGELLVLRLIHVLGAIFWLGSVLFTTFFLLPAMAAAGPAAGVVMANIQKRRFFVVAPTVAILTLLSGIRLMMITSGGYGPEYFARLGGRTYAAAAVCGILAFLVGMFLSRPAATRLGALSQQLATTSSPGDRDRMTAEIASQQGRAKRWGTATIVLLLLAAAGMAVARYL